MLGWDFSKRDCVIQEKCAPISAKRFISLDNRLFPYSWPFYYPMLLFHPNPGDGGKSEMKSPIPDWFVGKKLFMEVEVWSGPTPNNLRLTDYHYYEWEIVD